MILVFKTNSIIDSYRNTLEPNYSKRSNTSHRVLKSQILTLLLTSDDCKHVPPEHMHIILFHDAIKDGRLAAILVVKKKPDVEHVLNHFSDMHLPMLFKLGKQIMDVAFLQRHVIFFSRSDPRWPTGSHFGT